MSKLINLRPILLYAIFFALGLLLFYAVTYGYWYFAVVFLIAFALAVTVAAIKHKKRFIALFLMLAAFCFAGFTTFALEYQSLLNKKVGYLSGEFSAVVTDDVYVGDGYRVLTLRSVSYLDEKNNMVYLKSNASIMLWDSDFESEDSLTAISDFVAGNNIFITGVLTDVYVFKDGVDVFAYNDDTLYCFDSYSSVAVTKGDMSFDEKARAYVKSTLNENMENGDLAFALLTGDKSLMDGVTKSAFRVSGLSHLLAVSGLHIGFLVTVFHFIYRKLKINQWAELPLLIIPLLVYGYICGFPSSIVRATVMATVALLTQCFFARTDALNSLSFAALIIMAVRPLSIFDGGFLLGIGAVFGLICFTALANRFIQPKRLPKIVKILLSYLFASVGATLGTLPWAAHYFNYVSFAGIFLNVLIIPIISIAFVLSFVGLLPSFFHYVLYLPDKILLFTKNVALYLSDKSYAGITLVSFGVAAVLLGVWLFVFGGFVNLRSKTKGIALGILAVVFCTLAVLNALPASKSNEVFVAETERGNCIVVCNEKDDYLILSDFRSYAVTDSIMEYLEPLKINSVSLCLWNYSECDTKQLDSLTSGYNLKNVYLFDTDFNYDADVMLQSKRITVTTVPRGTALSIDGFVLRAHFDGVLVAVTVELEDCCFAVVTTDNEYLVESLYETVEEPLCFVCTPAAAYTLANHNEQTYVFSKYFYQKENILSSIQYGNFTIKLKDGKMSIKL